MHFDEETSNHHYLLLLQAEPHGYTGQADVIRQFLDCKKQEIAVAKEFERESERRTFN